MDGTQQVVAITGGVLAIVGLAGGWWYKWGRQMTATSEAILGRAEVTDRSGAVIQEAQPGMPAQVARLTEMVGRLADMHHRVDSVENRLGRVEERVEVLEAGTVERVMTKVESATAFSAIEAAVKATPED